MSVLRRFLHRYGPHGGLIAARAAAVVLFCLAGVTVAGAYLSFLPAVVAGAVLGTLLGLGADYAAYVCGRRDGWAGLREHRQRQAADRAAAQREVDARHNEPRPRDPATRTVRTAYGAGVLRPAPGPAGAAVAAATLVLAARETGVVLGRPAVAEAAGSRLVADLGRPAAVPLSVAFSVLAGGGDDGMTVDAVAAEISRRRGVACTWQAALQAVQVLESAGRATAARGAGGARYRAVTHESLLAGPGLRERVLRAVQRAPDAGLTVPEIHERVTADDFDVDEARVREAIQQGVDRLELWRAADGERIQLPPF